MAEITEPDEHLPGATQDEQLLESPGPDEFTHTDTWRVFRIMGEFVEGFDELATLTRGISIFGSAARVPAAQNTWPLRRRRRCSHRLGSQLLLEAVPGLWRPQTA